MPDDKLPIEVTVAQMLGEVDLDPMLIRCPACGATQLRVEVRTMWIPMPELLATFGGTAADVRASGAIVDAFGRVKSAVPYCSCMACGADFDASKKPPL
ncbi:hypothetical protein ACYX8G_19550 [Microbacterium saperdae]